MNGSSRYKGKKSESRNRKVRRHWIFDDLLWVFLQEVGNFRQPFWEGKKAHRVPYS